MRKLILSGVCALAALSGCSDGNAPSQEDQGVPASSPADQGVPASSPVDQGVPSPPPADQGVAREYDTAPCFNLLGFLDVKHRNPTAADAVRQVLNEKVSDLTINSTADLIWAVLMDGREDHDLIGRRVVGQNPRELAEEIMGIVDGPDNNKLKYLGLNAEVIPTSEPLFGGPSNPGSLSLTAQTLHEVPPWLGNQVIESSFVVDDVDDVDDHGWTTASLLVDFKTTHLLGIEEPPTPYREILSVTARTNGDCWKLDLSHTNYLEGNTSIDLPVFDARTVISTCGPDGKEAITMACGPKGSERDITHLSAAGDVEVLLTYGLQFLIQANPHHRLFGYFYDWGRNHGVQDESIALPEDNKPIVTVSIAGYDVTHWRENRFDRLKSKMLEMMRNIHYRAIELMNPEEEDQDPEESD